MRVVRIVRTPALESAIARFDVWWNARSPRERAMLAVLGTLLAGLVLVFAVIQPLQNARAKALADIRTYETINARLRIAGPIAPRRTPRNGAPSQVISASAASFGLAPRVEPVPGGVRAVIADASYETIMAWLADLGATAKLRVRSVSLQRGAAPGRVSATIGFGT